LNAALRKAMNRPRECSNEDAPRGSDQEQDAPAADRRKAAVDGEYSGNPGDRRKDKEQCVNEAASKGDTRLRAEHDHQQDPYANPRINREIEAGKRQRKSSTADRRDRQAQGRRRLAAGMWAQIAEPVCAGHQCFTKARKPAASRPFLAASADFWSG